jgi:porin
MKDQREPTSEHKRSGGKLPAILAILVCNWAAPALGQTDASQASGFACSPSTKQAPSPEIQPETLTGDWGGLRTRLYDEGVDFSGDFKGEFASDPQGGTKFGATEVGQFSLGAAFDTKKLFDLTGGTFQVSITYRQGATLASHFGLNLLQQVQEVYGRGDVARLTELSYQQDLAGGAVTVKLGRLPEVDFDSFPCEFMSNALCAGTAGGNIASDYWYNSPISQWAGWVRVNTGDFYSMLGAYESNPRDLDESFAPGWFHGATGLTGRAEEGWTPRIGADQLLGLYQAGLWYDTAGGNDVLLGNNGQPDILTGLPALHRDGRYGYYIQALQQLTGIGDVVPGGWKAVEGLTFFFNFIQADRATTIQDNQVAAGIFYAAPFASRPDDHIGVGMARTDYNDRAAEAISLANPGAARPQGEYSTEFFYSYLLTPWLTVRPDLQYIFNPGGYSNRTPALVIGARTDVVF